MRESERYCCALTASAHAGILSTDWASAGGAVATRGVRRQTWVVPFAVATLVPGRAPTPVVRTVSHARTRSAVQTRRRVAGFQLQQLAVGPRASRRALAAVPGTS